jgi:Flp pilus assembly pilin Flp
MPTPAKANVVRRLLADERGSVSTEYVILTALSLALAVAIGASALGFQTARERSEELLRSNIP